MALFKRNKNTDNQLPEDIVMPKELQEYYQAETRERSWMAWVLGLATLVITVVVALGLFYGGRYAYRKIRKPNNQPAVVQNETQSEDESKSDEEETAPEVATNPAPVTPSPSTTPTTQPQTSSTTTTTPRAATSTPTTMPNTGAADTIAVFAIASVLAYTVHRRLLASR